MAHNIFVLPITYIIFQVLFYILHINKYSYRTFPSLLFEVAAFIKYCLIPIILWSDNSYYDVIGPDPSSNSIILAVRLTLYEMSLLYLLRYTYIIKSKKQQINKRSGEIIIKNINKFLFLFIIVGAIFTILFPNLMFPDFYLFKDKNEVALEEKVPIFPILISIWKYIMFLLLISIIYKAYLKHKINVGTALMYTFISYLICLLLTLGDSRWNVIFFTFYFFIIINYLYPAASRKYIVFVSPIFVLLILFITIYKFRDDIELLSDGSVVATFAQLFSYQLQAYFSGISLVAQSVDMSNDVLFNPDFTIKTLLNDFIGTIPIVSKLVTQSMRTNFIFNQYVLGVNTIWFTQIIPSTAIGYIYFGFWLSPVFTILFNLLGLYFEKRAICTNSIFLKYIYIMASFWLSLSICFNTQIPFGNIVVYQLPIFIVYYIFSHIKLKV